eukprot:377956_1
MPFPARVVSKRVDIDEVFNNTTDNILQKTSVSNLLGLLNQLNQISLHASEIFTDVLNTTTNTNNRIKTVKQRIKNLNSKIPKVENLLISHAPSYFYDNPYSGKEYLRNDPLNGLLFSREDATPQINKRRNIATPPANLSALDTVSINNGNGPCIKRFTDPDFFIDEWLQNEKRKQEEARQQRRKDRQNRKKERIKRKRTKKIKKLKRIRYDAQGNVIADDGTTEIAVNTDFKLTDDTNRNFDALLSKKKGGKKKIKKVIIEEKEEKQAINMQKHTHSHVVSYNIPIETVKSAHVNVLSDNNISPPPIPVIKQEPIINYAHIKTPPPNPMMSSPPPNPLMLKQSQSTSEKSAIKLRGLSSKIPMDDISYDIPDNAPSPAEIYAINYQKRDLNNEHLNLSSGSKIITETPKQVVPVAPIGFLDNIKSFNKKGKLKKTEININRHKPKDKRTNLIHQIKNNKMKLSSVNLRKVAPKKEEKKNLIFEAMAARRKLMEDSSDDDASWGSESE